ncbi:hypothetical protein Droror1_Dr00028163 [Drosera rotundifolia]
MDNRLIFLYYLSLVRSRGTEEASLAEPKDGYRFKDARYAHNAEVSYAILPGKARTTFSEKRYLYPKPTQMRTTCTWTERPYEASLFPGIGFGYLLQWKAKKAPARAIIPLWRS